MSSNLFNYGLAVGITVSSVGCGILARNQYIRNKWPFNPLRTQKIYLRDASSLYGILVTFLVGGILSGTTYKLCMK